MLLRASWGLRSAFLCLSVLMLFLVLVAGCGGSGGGGKDQEQQPSEEQLTPVAGSFVGRQDDLLSRDPDAFVALVVSSVADEGEDEREVRAYLCDGEISEWFWGSVTGNELDLTSDNGARLQASLTPEAANGTITLDDPEEAFTFTANPATAASGLYEVTIANDLSFNGTSQEGGRIEGQIAQEADSEGQHPISATLTSRDGESLDLDLTKAWATNPSPGEARFIWCDECNRLVGKDKEGSGGVRSSCTDYYNCY